MENKKSIPLIVLAVFSIVILLAQNNIEKVFALIVTNRPVGDAPQSIYQYQDGNLTAVLNVNDDTVSVYNTDTMVLVRTIDISTGWSPLAGSVVANHIACSNRICITTANVGGTSFRAFAFNIDTGQVGTLATGKNFTSTTPPSPYGFEVDCSGITQCTMWVMNWSASPGTWLLKTYSDNGDILNTVWTVVVSFNTGLATSGIIGNMKRQPIVISGNTHVMLAYYFDTGFVFMQNLGTTTQACSVVVGAVNTSPDIEAGFSNDFLFADAGSGLRRITFSSPTACAIANTIANTQFESNNPLSLTVSASNNEYYIQAGTSIYIVNATTLLTTSEIITGATAEDGTDYDISLDTIVTAVTSTDKVWFIKFEGASSSAQTFCIDANLNGVIDNSDPCFVDTNGDGVVDAGPAGNLAVLRTGANVTEFGFQINCAFGFGSCTDHNPKTNGIGLFYFLLLLIVSYAFLVFIHISAVRMLHKENVQVMEYLHIHPILLLVVLITDLAITWQFQWIPDLIFYSIIVVLVAGLTGFAFYSKLKSGGG